MVTLSNEKLIIKILEKGAELQSVQFSGLEYLWQADGAYWAKHSPILFPVVGQLKNDTYIFEGREYKLPRHGFARDKIFEVIQASDSSVLFTLHYDADSLRVYPFRFVLKITYRIEGSRLFCSYVVENADTKLMYFSIGGHPAFNVPLQKNLQYPDYSLQFNDDTALKRYSVLDGLIGDDVQIINLPGNNLQLQQSLFYDDAIVLKYFNSTQIKLASDKDNRGLNFTFNGFPYFGIWAAKDAPFICLEPWCGIADNVDHDHQLIHKEGINQLAAGEIWQRTWSAEVF